MPKRIERTPELLEEVRRLYVDEGITVTDIAKRLGHGWATIRAMLVEDLGLIVALKDDTRDAYLPSPEKIKMEVAKLRRKREEAKDKDGSHQAYPAREPRRARWFPARFTQDSYDED